MSDNHTKGSSNKLKLAITVIMFILVLLAGLFGAWILSILSSIPENDLSDLKVSIAETSTILDAKGNMIDEVDPSVFSENVSLDQVPDHVKEAFLAIEDRSFYDHHGLDLRQILASLRSNLKSGQIERGGSTITQQLVKNVYLNSDQSIDRKVKEAYITLALEDTLSKDDIFEAYLNRIDLGLGSQGIEAASQAYFSKHVEELTLEEGALLAAVVKSPATYQPLKRVPADGETSGEVIGTQQIGDVTYNLEKNERALKRKNTVLSAMASSGYITKDEARAASNKTITYRPKDEKPAPYSSYVADYISDEAVRILMRTRRLDEISAKKLVQEGGLTIQSTIVPAYQKGIEELYDRYGQLLSRGIDRGANFVDFDTDAYANIVDGDGHVLYFNYNNYFDDRGNLHLSHDAFTVQKDGIAIDAPCFIRQGEAVQLQSFYYLDSENNLHTLSGGSTVFEPGDVVGESPLKITKEALSKYGTSISTGDDELVLASDLFVMPSRSSLQPQSAALITDNATGGIVALAGGNDLRDPARQRFNHLYSKRQPGTALIPLTTYFTALSEGDTLASCYDDTPMRVDGDIWPNARTFYGYDVLADALANTREAVSGKILEHYGFEAVLKNLELLGLYGGKQADDAIRTSDEDAGRHDLTYDALASGNLIDGLNLDDLVNSYSKIASPREDRNYSISEIKDRDGRILYRHKNKAMKFPNHSDALLRYGLSGSPLSLKLKENGYDAFAVFGTNKYNSDYFVVGSTPRFTYGLWMGNEIQKLALSPNQSLAEDFYASMYAVTDDRDAWSLPESFEMKEVSRKTGLLASSYAKRARSTITLPFLPNTAPTEVTENYTRKLICSVSGELASTYCPDETITYGYYFVRPKGYNPDDFDGILPKDYNTVPYRHCHIHTKEWYEDMIRMQEELERQQEEEQEDENANDQGNNDQTDHSGTNTSGSRYR
ncbi:MAG: transglycosylase domain-containing protein [Peptoniphilus sp.]|nr:transglycosylase domain-containing protein [Peptoniphilus sp.]MDD7363120.1 transglycosylase domain-containing protein [Bacillota bacterium]MDY6044358.1 transglycosylase domain-containing protein [Peptoniphilus sp.]